ncbi:MAG: histidinol-phosphate aminotransferase [Gammaproteobacteria bacterium]|jgi:histidinol-phosphate aminotransferase
MSKYWSPIVGTLTPYVPGEQPRDSKLIKLNTNENPYAPSPAALAAIRAETTDSLKLYPDPEALALKVSLARHHAIDVAQIFVGNGSDEVLAHVFLGLLKHDKPILLPDIGYSFYPVYCGLYDIQYQTVALNENFEIDLRDYEQDNGGVIFANPNAPTGIALAPKSIESFLRQSSNSVVVIDEAYVAFGADSIVQLIKEFPNLLVVQTLSKSHALAGLRVGFAFGDPNLIEALDRIKNSFNSYPLDRLAIAGAVAAINDQQYFESSRQKIIATRERLSLAMRRLGFMVLPSQTNFVFASSPNIGALELLQALRQRSIIVRHLDHPRTADYVRITVGTDAEIDSLIASLELILND